MGEKTRLYDRKSHPLVASLAAESWGVVSLEELLACGLTEEVVGGWVAAGHLHRVHRGVYAVGHTGLTPEGRWLAAVKACRPDAILDRSSSVMLFELSPVEDRRPEVIVPHGQVRAPAGIRVHRTRSLHPEDVVRHKGIPTTSAARTIMDLAATLDDVPLRRLMSRAQSRHLTNLRLLARQLDRAAGRAGRARFARVLSTQPPATRS